MNPPPETALASSPHDARIRVPKAAELVADRIRRQIIQGELLGDEMLPSESALIVQHGVSRPTVREAIRILEAEGLVYMQRGRGGGARVIAPNGTAATARLGLMLEYLQVPLAELVIASDTIQQGSAEVLARSRSRDDLAALKRNLRQGRSCRDDPDELVRVTTEFHMIMVRRLGSRPLSLLYEMLNHLIVENLRRANDPDPTKWGRLAPTEGQRHHEEVVALIEARDVSAADQLWRQHIADCRSFALKAARPKAT